MGSELVYANSQFPPEEMEEKKPRHKEAKDPDRAINIGELIDGRWEVIRMLGEGGFGAVYEVRDTRGPASSDTFAMKVRKSFLLLRSIIAEPIRSFRSKPTRPPSRFSRWT